LTFHWSRRGGRPAYAGRNPALAAPRPSSSGRWPQISVPHIPDDRPLSTEERTLVRWLLEHGRPEANRYLDHLGQARVVSRCSCGCARVRVEVGRQETARLAGMQLLADYHWRDRRRRLAGIFAFARDGVLAGLEVWSIDGEAAIEKHPPVEVLEPLGSAT